MGIRIIDHTTDLNVRSDDFLIKDSSTNGTKKITPEAFAEYTNDQMKETVSSLTEATSLDDNDLLYVVTPASPNVAKKVKKSTLKSEMKPSDYTGATSSTNGANGLVPQPTTSDVDRFLKGDGTWGDISYAVGEASGSIATFSDGSPLPMRSLKAYIEPVQSGSGEPSPSNIRPISGWTACNVVRTGKNLVYNTISKATISSNGEFVIRSSLISDMQIAQVKKGIVYTITSDELFVGGFFTSEPTNGSVTYNNSRWADTPKTFTAPIDGYVAFRTSNGYSTPQMEVGSTSSSYEPYNGTTYTIQFTDGSNPLTVYGGYVDIVSGVLTVDRASITLNGTQNVSFTSFGGNYRAAYTVSDASKKYSDSQLSNVICDRYPTIPYDTAGSASLGGISLRYNIAQINVFQNQYTDYQSWNTYLASNPMTVVYELATPTIIQLTPTQVKSLLGENRVWADTGDVDVHYVRDLTITIDDILSRLEALES